MNIPKTTPEKPYIEFRFNKQGIMSLKATSNWWGGKSSGFFSSDGSEGNSCPPDKLNAYIKAFKQRKIKEIEKEIKTLKDKLANIKAKYQ